MTAEPLLLAGVGSYTLELLKAVLVMVVPVVPVTVAVMLRTALTPLARVGILGQMTVRVVGLKVPPLSALTKVKFVGS